MSSRWAADRFDPAAYVGPIMELPVFYSDLDTNGHLNNVALGRFFEHSRFSTHTHHRVPDLVQQHGAAMVIARVAIDYIAEGQVGIPIGIGIRVAKIGRTSVTEEQAAWQGEICIGLAETVVAYRENGAAAAWPDDLLALLTAMGGATA